MRDTVALLKRKHSFPIRKTIAHALPALLLLALCTLAARSASAQSDLPGGVLLSAAAPASLNAAPPLNCSATASGFKLTIDTEHSSVAGSSVICNYVADTQGKTSSRSGFAVTIEYFCAKDTQAAWQSKTASQPRWQPGTNPNGEISRSGNAVLFREDGEVSGFAGTFTVAEKMFLLIDAQTIATIVVHTDVKTPDAPASGPAPNPDPKVLNLDATQVAGVASAVAGAHRALVNDLQCTTGPPPTPISTALASNGLKLRVRVSFPEQGTAGDEITIKGVVWSVDADGWYHLPVQAKVHISQGDSPAVDVTTNSVGYFSVGFTPIDLRFNQIEFDSTPLNPNGYQAQTVYYPYAIKERGALAVTIATNKAIYAPGELVTISGMVTSEDKPFPAPLGVYSDALAQPSVMASDGSYSYTFVPGQEKNRSILGTFQNGLHTVSVKTGATGYADALASATYLVEQSLTCDSLPIQVTSVSGRPQVLPIDPNSMIGGDSVMAQLSTVNASTKLAQGMKVSTSAGAQVALRLEGEQGASATIAINDSSTVQIQAFCKDKTTGRIQAVLVVDGPGQVVINKTSGGSIFSNLDLAIVSKAARVTSVHTRYFVGIVADGTTTIVALQDTAIVSMPDGTNSINLPAVNRIVIRPGEKPDASKISPMDGTIDPSLEGMLGGGRVPQPNTSVAGMTVQAAQRQVIAGGLVYVPVWLVNANNVANINLQITYDPRVVKPEGTVAKGDLLDNALFTVNPNQPGSILSGFAQTSGLSGTGTVLNIPFRAVGKPGDHTPVTVSVAAINDPSGDRLNIDSLAGEIWVYNTDGSFPPASPSGPGSTTPPGGSPIPGGASEPLPPPQILLGDCDGDGALTELDALCALEMSTRLRPSQPIMDLDNSGDVTSRDAVIILQKALGK